MVSRSPLPAVYVAVLSYGSKAMDVLPLSSSAIEYETPSGLKPLPQPLETDRPIRWLGDDGRNVFIEIQGQLVAVAVRKGPLPYQPSLRSEVAGFSRASRLRLFKVINRLDFASAGRCTFMTGTWRDELGRPEPEKITQARSVFQRSIERLSDTKVPGVWRVEWQKRKSGGMKGQFMPHVHIVYFRIPYLRLLEVTRAWGQAIGWEGRVSVKLQEIRNLRQCMYYVSKYIAKVDESGNLDIPSYLNKYLPGRKWGVFRKDLMPLAEKTEIRVAPGELVEQIRKLALEAYKDLPTDPRQGFTVFGSPTREIQRLIDEYCLQLPEEVIE